MLADGTLEYIYTAGVLVSFLALMACTVLNRKRIRQVLHGSGFTRRDLALAIVPVIIFVAIFAMFMKPTQLLFFDDAIYQAMGVSLIHSGQAWMCNYGTPTHCLSGQIFHEPIGLSFNLAIGFLLLGVSRYTGYAVQVALAALSVFMTFILAFVLLKDRRAALFAAIALALLPIILMWAAPTNSDMATLAYSLISFFMLVILIRSRSVLSLAAFLFSLSLLLYMKVDALVYVPIFAIAYILLYERGIVKSVTESARAIYKNLLNTNLLLVLLLFILVAFPTIQFAVSNGSSDGYGYQGTTVQLTCQQSGSITASGTINLANFEANICANVLFWTNKYAQQQVTQPLYLTLLALLGALLMLVSGKGRVLAAILVWFGAIFLLYTAFYAGSAVYGVDWRFMIDLMAPFAILVGFAVSGISASAERLAARIKKHPQLQRYAGIAVSVILGASLFYVLYLNASTVFLNPASIQQAGDARFYENFVYNSSHLIPAGCLVYTYDPTLFNLNNRSASQLSNLYTSSFYANASKSYPCAVLDVGYWCNTPGNICTQAKSTYNLTPIATATYNRSGFTYGLYRMQGTK